MHEDLAGIKTHNLICWDAAIAAADVPLIQSIKIPMIVKEVRAYR
jgi:hypothetical protein